MIVRTKKMQQKGDPSVAFRRHLDEGLESDQRLHVLRALNASPLSIWTPL